MHPLDSVIWQALNTSQAHLADRNAQAAKFQKEVSILAALAQPAAESYVALGRLLGPGERAGLFLSEPPQPPAGWNIVSSVPLLQMIHEGASPAATASTRIISLSEKDVPEMMELTGLTRPGPFGRRTREMGDYFGIRENGQLIAMAGERLRLPGYTEISAVCTHPEHLGKGYAGQLMTLLLSRIRGRGEQAFLHVRADNERAVGLYEKLGFRKRQLLRYAIVSNNA